MKKAYYIAAESDVQKLEDHVNMMMGLGFMPHGNIAVAVSGEDDQFWFYQPMLKQPKPRQEQNRKA